MEKFETDVGLKNSNYSSIRKKQNKWRTKEIEEGQEYVLIDKDYYNISELIRRRDLKQNSLMIKRIYNLWKLLNPFHIAGISRYNFFQIIRHIYCDFFKVQVNREEIDACITNDIELDFKNRPCMYFSMFHDTIFDIVDQYTSSKNLSEFTFTISSIILFLKNSDVLSNLNLHSKAHCQGEKPHFYYWMKNVINIKEKNNINNQNIKKKSEKSMKKNIILPRIKSSVVIMNEKLMPLSIHKKSKFIKAFVLEDIIQGRNKYLTMYNQEKKKNYHGDN